MNFRAKTKENQLAEGTLLVYSKSVLSVQEYIMIYYKSMAHCNTKTLTSVWEYS